MKTMSNRKSILRPISFGWAGIMNTTFVLSMHRIRFVFSHNYPPSLGQSLSSFFALNIHSMQSQTNRRYRSSGVLRLNRILFDQSEIDNTSPEDGDEFIASVTLSKNDYRTIHVAKILGLQNGDTLRAGSVRSPRLEEANELSGLVTDHAIITWLPEGKIKKAKPTANGEPPGSLRISIPKSPKTLLWGDRTKSQMTEGDIDLLTIPPVSLLLALPRPLQLGRILPIVTQLGVDRIILTNAKKVPKVSLSYQVS